MSTAPRSSGPSGWIGTASSPSTDWNGRSSAPAQRALDAGAESPAALLLEIGAVRLAQEAARGGASLNLPDEEVVRGEDGSYAIVRRNPLPVEDANAQLSLMTGMAAAELMIDARVGVLRTMPQPDENAFTPSARKPRRWAVPGPRAATATTCAVWTAQTR